MILDINMPSGNGLDVAERLLQDPKIPPVPVIFCTGRSDPDTLERCRSLGAICVVKDGDTWSKLLPVICRILGLTADIAVGAPIPAPALVSTPAPASVPEPHKSKALPRLLFVDDDPDLRRALQIRLRACEVEVVVAGNAMQALWMAVNDAPDIVVTDYYMPQGSGEYLISRLRAVPSLKELPVILLTGAGTRDFAMERRFLGEYNVSAVLYKPLNFDALLEALSRSIPVNADVWKAASKMRRR
jgi:CheY-like chemotaxis protein